VAFTLQERFEVHAPVERVWLYLIDPRQVIGCVPGAELTTVENDRTFQGRMTIKVGPVTAAYQGRITIAELDETARIVTLAGDGVEQSGAGSARVRMTTRVLALPNGATEIAVDADLELSGTIAQFGRTMIEAVNAQLFRQFADCMRGVLEMPERVAAAAAATGVPQLQNTVAGMPALQRPTPPRQPTPAPQLQNTAFAMPAMRRPQPAPQNPAAAQQPPAPPPPPKAISVVPPLARAIWEVILGFVKRIFGR
jgi:carbon monoxide dehydrogenase subunit G